MLSRSARLRLMRLAKTMVKKVSFRNLALPAGISSRFIKLTESFGLRVTPWASRHEVVDTYDNHKKAYSYGLAPYCFGFLSVYDSNDVQAYGYIVQTVCILHDWLAQNHFSRHENCYASGRMKIPVIDRQGPRLYHRIFRFLGFYCGDSHLGNAGFLGRKLVCVDFGKEGRYDHAVND